MHILFITSTRLGMPSCPQGCWIRCCTATRGRISPLPAGRWPPACSRTCRAACVLIEMVKRPRDMHWVDLWRQCRGTRWDLCVDLRGSIVSYFLRVGRRHIMRGGRREGRRITHIGNLLDLDPAPMPVTWTSAGERARAAAMLPDDGSRWIALGPTANWDGKIWPADRFVTVFNTLRAADPAMRPVILYGPGEAERARARTVLAQLPDALDTGALSVTQVAALLARCTLFIGNDSGLMHLDAAAGIPTVGCSGAARLRNTRPQARGRAWSWRPARWAMPRWRGWMWPMS
ncbi:glycosyltransferase family 9 protein [Komagataeibacter rhaeticus]|nr:glycosyltransferase family 9 protein [Komagataeibacter rhaeticus]